MASNRESLSAQSKRRTNYLLLVFGIIMLLLFLLAWCRMQPEEKKQVVQRSAEDWRMTDLKGNDIASATMPNLSSRGDALLVVTPSGLDAQKVVIGSESEWSFILRAENAPVLLISKTLAEKQEDGFELSGPCMSLERLAKDEECILKVSWTPTTLRNIQNILTIIWREHNAAEFKKERTDIVLKAQSTDSKDCVICEDIRKEAEKVPRKIVDSRGNERDLQPGEEDKFKKGYYRDPDTGEFFIVEPEYIPLNLQNEVIGTVADNRDVIDFNGKKLGRLLGDGTIIDPTQTVIVGKAIPFVPAMNEKGQVFGEMVLNGNTVSVVNKKGEVLGFPHVDGQVVDEQNNPIGFISPWGATIDSMGKFLGVILPDGSVINGTKKVASMRPMGFAVNDKGELVGGAVPRGVGVGAGGRSLGEVSLTGEVKDSFGQTAGHVLLDKAIVDAQMNEIGSLIRQGVVIDNSGKPVGYVNSEGKALNFKASQIGVMNPDGTAFAHKKFVGSLMPEGLITKGRCSYVGSVYPDGKVVDFALKNLGHITPNGMAFDNKNNEIGVIVPWGTAIAPGCRLLGLISLNGDVVSTNGVKMGCVNPNKTVQNLQGQDVGEVTPLGIYINEQNQVVGRVRLDGQIMDHKGQIIGCVYEKKLQVIGFNTKGVIVDENGYPLGGTSIGNKAYDEAGNWIGDVSFNGWVIGEKGQLKGALPFSGTIFSDTGKVLGRYDQLTGTLIGENALNSGRVLPGLSVINATGTEILGKLIPTGTSFVKLDGSFLGTLRSDGVLVGTDQASYAIIHADGTVTNKEGTLLGARLPTGPVISGNGKYVGQANMAGEILDNRGLKMGRVLPNGLAISDKNQVIGQVFPGLSVGVSVRGFMGSIEPKISGLGDNVAYQLQVNDTKGNLVGAVSGTGVILGLDNSVAGNLVPVAPFIDPQGKLLGWSNFKGELNNPEGRVIGTILPSGVALDISQNLVGSVISEGIAVDAMGAYLGFVGAQGSIISSSGERLTTLGTSPYLHNADGAIVGQVLRPGIAISLDGQWMGWTRLDGQIENGAKVLGSVGLDGHIFDATGMMIGRYVPLGEIAFNDAEKSVGFLTDSGDFIEAGGLSVAKMGYEPYVATKGTIIGRELKQGSFVTSLENGRVLGLASEDGSVISVASDKAVGSIKMNNQFVNSANQLEGGVVPAGLAIMPTLGMIGSVGFDGQVYKVDKKVGITTGTGLVYSPEGELIGGVFSPGVLIDKKGAFAGTTSGTPSVLKNGKSIGNKMAFNSALSSANDWIGNTMPSGGIVDDMGQYYGAITTTDGTVVGSKDTFAGRVLPDGSVAGVPEKAVFNTMPYTGHTVQQGIPVGLNQGFKVVGKTTAVGDVVDNFAKKLFRIIDNAYVVNKAGQKPPVVARVFPIISAVDNDGGLMGVASSDGTIVSYKGQVNGRVDNGGFVRSNDAQTQIDELRIQGLLVPEGLVVNNCKVVGQTAYDGRVINGQGSVVGRIRRDLWAIDANGSEIGRVVRNNEPCIAGKTYMGRTLPDSTVVDLNGVEIGCATNSGEMLSPSGEVLCKIVERGVIIDPNTGEIIGWGRATGTWTNGDGDKGYLDDKGDAYDWNDNMVGHNFGGNQTIFVNDKGTVDYIQDGTDAVKKPDNEIVFKVPPVGNPTDPWNNPLCGGLSPYINGLGCLQSCDLMGYDGQKIASLMADGTFRDENGDLVYTVTPDGQVYAPNGTFVEKIRGLDVTTSLKQCGMAGSGKGGKRSIRIGSMDYIVDQNGSIMDEDGMIIGYLGEDGRPYSLGNKLLTGSDIEGRERPDTTPKFKPTQEQKDDFADKLDKRRKGMKAEMGKGILTISAEMEARARPKKDKDWSKVGVNKESISSWPVDMTHVILQGKAIPAVLARSIDSRYNTVPAIAIVETNIYGEEGRNILIPAGSRLIGTFGGEAGDQQNGVAKLQIAWTRLIRPDGVAFNLNSAKSGDSQGRGAVAAYLDEQLWNKYGTTVLSTLASTAVSYMLATNDEIQSSGQGQYSGSGRSVALAEGRAKFIETIGDILDDMIDKAQQTPPVVYVPSGTRLTVFPEQDLWLRSADDDAAEMDREFGALPTSAQVPDMSSWTQKRRTERDENMTSQPENSTINNPQKETETPLYDGTDHMPDITDRKVEPVAPQEEPLF